MMTNGRSLPLAAIPTLAYGDFARLFSRAVASRCRVASYFGHRTPSASTTSLYAVFADDRDNSLHVARAEIEGDRVASLTNDCPQVHLFEREIAEQFGIVPEHHPWLKPVRNYRVKNGRKDLKSSSPEELVPGVTDFYRVEGDEVHEVAVGPVHAGIIEPGHFRFQCHGEVVYHLEIALGYQHRGVEQAMLGGPHKRSIHFAETLAGDTTIAHATSYCQVLESLSNCQKSARAQTLRGIALELERLANHTGDLGALSGDVGFLPTASFCGRIRGDFLNMTALLCGNRFGRGMIRPGGVGFDADEERIERLSRRLALAARDVEGAVSLLWDTVSVMARFEGVGMLSMKTASELGIVGPAARASGLVRDARNDQPSGIFRFAQIPVSTCDTGDVFARAFVRWLEIQQSMQFIQEQLQAMPGGEIQVPLGKIEPNCLAVALNEGWRGEVCHVAITDDAGRFARYKIVDPSFHNWSGLAHALRNQQISDFPLCNKSFNLSYCGFDL
jgi:Ni,Fe-hydrogenase III large subunit